MKKVPMEPVRPEDWTGPEQAKADFLSALVEAADRTAATRGDPMPETSQCGVKHRCGGKCAVIGQGDYMHECDLSRCLWTTEHGEAGLNV